MTDATMSLQEAVKRYQDRFGHQPPLVGVPKDVVIQKVVESIRTGKPYTFKDLGLPTGAYS